MHSTPNDHIYNLPMIVRVENAVKYRQQMKAVNYTSPEPKSGLNNTVNSSLEGCLGMVSWFVSTHRINKQANKQQLNHVRTHISPGGGGCIKPV